MTPRGRDRRAQLMDFAAHRFAEHGYHPTSVAEIVSGIGVGKGVFYWYFTSKEELLVEILRDGQYELRRVHHCPRDRDPLLHAAAEGTGRSVCPLEHRHAAQRVFDSPVRIADSVQTGRK